MGLISRGGSSPLSRIDRPRRKTLRGRFVDSMQVLMAQNNSSKGPQEPVIENRKARHNYTITDTLECGIKLKGSEIKSIRSGLVSLAEGFVMATEQPISMTLHAVHIAEYAPAGSHRQHAPTRTRSLLAHRREIKKWAIAARSRGCTIVPLKMYFVDGRAKLLVGLGTGKKSRDKRQDLKAQEAKRDIDRAMKRR